MNKVVFLILSLFILSNCSLKEKSSLWNKDEKTENQKNIKQILTIEKNIVNEFNQDLKLDLSKISLNNEFNNNRNDYGAQNYKGELKKIGNYKFSKLENINQLNFKPIFLDNGIIFFDKKGSIIRYNENQKIVWKSNHYSKAEKKLNPKLYFALDKQNLIIADNISKYYSININTGKLNWSKNNKYPFNSEIKKVKSKFFVVDYKNTLRCFSVYDGSECWNLQTEESFTISDSKYSLIVVDDMVVFSNSIGDISAVDINTGLIGWQLPTQSSNITNETYDFKTSKLVSDNNSIFFSTNKDEFYSIDVKTGTINWINKVSSNITPIVIGNLIFTVSNEGYLFVVEKNKGNIVRITDLFKNYKIKKRKNIKAIGFVIGNTNLYLTKSDGKMIVVDLSLGNVISSEKISGSFTSEPFIFNNSLFVIKNGSITQYN
ncbi:PQQ-like beta-propeller repeat protein [Candidatus Pelagibacter sp.]|nr:PQQ-like beta-propeller repeat protein [Candidatus Pelagibacter sp.]